MKPVAMWLIGALLLSACDCGGGRVGATIDVRVGLTRSELGGMGCADAAARSALPADWACTQLSLQASTGRFVPITIPGTDTNNFEGAVVLPLGANNDFSFDVPEGLGPLQLALSVHNQAGTPLASGSLAVTDLAGPLVVPTQLLGSASCLVTADGETPVPRALHKSLLLPNGDVLVFGGVEGETEKLVLLPPGGDQVGLDLQPVVESYRPSDGSWVRARESADSTRFASFGVVFFGADVDPSTGGTQSGAPIRVRTVGGWTSQGRALVGLDADQLVSETGAPVVPLPSALPASDFELVYDPVSRSVDVSRVSAAAANLGSVTSGPVVNGEVLALGQLQSAGVAPSNEPPAVYTARAFSVPTDQTTRTEVGAGSFSERFGASVSRLPDGTGWLVLGGIRTPTIGTLAANAAAQVVSGTRTPLALTFVGTASSVVAEDHVPGFHSAARVGSQMVMAGGLQGSCDCGGAGQFPYRPSLLSAPVLASLAVVGGELRADAVPGATLAPSILHGTTHLRVSNGTGHVEDVSRWLVTGGAGAGLTPLDQVVLVTESAGALSTTDLEGTATLVEPRWGHQAVALDANRVLVTGGIVQNGSLFRSTAGAEILTYGFSAGDPAAVPAGICQGAGGGGLDAGAGG